MTVKVLVVDTKSVISKGEVNPADCQLISVQPFWFVTLAETAVLLANVAVNSWARLTKRFRLRHTSV